MSEVSTAPLAEALNSACKVVAFTGAGISTESGIPDFTSPGGVWTRYDPEDFTFDRFVSEPEVRAQWWRLGWEFWGPEALPNAAHRALARLEAAGRMVGVVTQNIDGLHQAAGSRRVVELHGTSREVHCIGEHPRATSARGCGWRAPAQWARDLLGRGIEDLTCPTCFGLVKPATISYGQHLSPAVLDEAAAMIAEADLVLAIGTSLKVYPAAGLPAKAARHGTPVIIVNDGPTPLDEDAHAVVRGRAGEILPRVISARRGALGRGLGSSDPLVVDDVQLVDRPAQGARRARLLAAGLRLGRD